MNWGDDDDDDDGGVGDDRRNEGKLGTVGGCCSTNSGFGRFCPGAVEIFLDLDFCSMQAYVDIFQCRECI